jgi:hypothetical protein
LGFKCEKQSAGSGRDEPYFFISADPELGAPITKKFGPYAVEEGDEIGEVGFIYNGMPPNPIALRALAYENDEGDPDETQEKKKFR